MSNISFGTASRYVGVPPGDLVVQITKTGTTTVVEEGEITAIPNGAYSIAIAGSLSEPTPGKLLVLSEDLSPPHAGKFKGGWYQLSEIKTATDLRISKSATPNIEQARLVKVLPKTGLNYSELDAGSYNFDPVLPGKSTVLFNNGYNPPIRVEATAKIPSGWLFDLFAVGNPINQGANSLKLYTASYKVLSSSKSECTQVQ